ncbi:MAG: class I SAM-dependent methyltransferase [Candidatus Methylomirabilales bacterium]
MSEPSPRVNAPLPLETIACPLCGGQAFSRLTLQRDLALGVPGEFPLTRCDGCGLLYQNPRVRADQLSRAYPAEYAAHTRDPELSRTLRHMGAAVRWVLSRRLGYRHLTTAELRWTDRLRGILSRGRILKAFPPWIGQGRLLDVGCGSGKFLRQMGAVGWRLTGIEVDAEAAARAREVTPNVFVGDPTEAPFPEGSFDLITAFHVIEHLPDPLGALRNLVRWLAPGGLLIVEVPNAAGWGARLFGRYWSGLDFPRHLVHFTPATMTLMVEKAGGRVLGAVHRTKPRYFIRSLRHGFADGSGVGSRIGLALITSRLGGGILKLVLELLMPLARPLRRGEAVRYFIGRS